MQTTGSKSLNLENRILVTDKELTYLLGVGRQTAQEIAMEAGAVVRINRRKLNSVEKIKQYVERIAST